MGDAPRLSYERMIAGNHFMEVLHKGLLEQHFPPRQFDAGADAAGAAGGSGRKIIRRPMKKLSAIGIMYDVRGRECVAFSKFSRHFRSRGLRVPEIYAEGCLSSVFYYEEDFGGHHRFLRFSTDIRRRQRTSLRGHRSL